jgi:hypothetical protein
LDCVGIRFSISNFDFHIATKDDLLLLKKGGHVVYFGDLGDQSKNMIDYFEKHGASRIDIGDNPANWMLREIESSSNPKDLAEEYKNSSQFATLQRQLAELKLCLIPSLEITFRTRFASRAETRQRLMNKRLQTIYWRSPAYNRSRLLVCTIIAFILGAVFVTNRTPDVFTESDMRARLSVTFLSFIIIGILSITSVLPVMLNIRDVFYRHRAAGMLENISLGWALGTAEKWFIIAASFLFSLVFLSVAGHTETTQIRRGIGYWVSVLSKFYLDIILFLSHIASTLRASSRSTWPYTHTLDKLSCAWSVQ